MLGNYSIVFLGYVSHYDYNEHKMYGIDICQSEISVRQINKLTAIHSFAVITFFSLAISNSKLVIISQILIEYINYILFLLKKL